RWPIMLKLAGGSVVLHLIMLAVAFYVPAVRDALNLASTFSDSKMVDRDYRKTQINDQVQILNLPKFQYPEGYFQTVNGTPPMPDPLMPQIIAQAPPVVVTPPPPPVAPKMPRVKGPRGVGNAPLATASPSPAPGEIAPGIPNTPTGAQTANAEQPKTPAEADSEIAKAAKQNNIAQVSEDEINKKPLKDWLKGANQLKAEGKLDLSKPVEVVIIADFDEKGQLAGPPTVAQKSGDPVLIVLAKDLVSAIIDSNLTKFLRDQQNQLNTRQITITIKLDDQQLLGKVQYEAASPQRADQLSGGYNLSLLLAKSSRAGKDEEALLKNTKATSNGNLVILNFTMPRQEASELIKKQLAQPAT
ncbi:MAG: hypothetical protein JOZ52_01870, partial [Acidobacteria bacterium]|nr:hypothetical protein [Acidobacteriota bacterium]